MVYTIYQGINWWDGRGLMLWLFVGPTGVGFLLLRYSVLFTVESLSLLYLLFISWFICYGRWCIDKLGVFQQTKYLCVLIHIWIKGEVGAVKQVLSPPVKYSRDRSKAVLLLWIFYVFSILCLLCLCAHLFICALWSPAGKGLTSWLPFVLYNCEFVTFPLVSWVRCDTWLHRFLIFAPLLCFQTRKIK